jgi:CO/xanthine dehydrogenase Mo-binding subunit
LHRPRPCARVRPHGGCGEEGRALTQDPLKLATGRAAFAADLDLPGTLHAWAARWSQPATRLASVDASAARSLPGVVALIAALDADVKGLFDAMPRYAGAPFAVVAAEDLELAERAAEAVQVTATAEAPCFDVEGGPVVASVRVEEGALVAALGAADHVVEATFRWPYAEVEPVEPPTTLTWLDEDGRLVVRATTDSPFGLRAELARRLGLPAASLRVVRPQVGAPFGSVRGPREAALCAALTLRTTRPVRLVERVPSAAAPREAAHLVRMRAGFREGRLAVVDATLRFNLGALTPIDSVDLATLARPLRQRGLSAFRLDVATVTTNLRPLGNSGREAERALRFALESVMNDGARAAGLDPLTFRQRSAEPKLRDALRRGAALVGWGGVPGGGVPGAGDAGGVRQGRGVAVSGAWSAPGEGTPVALTRNQDGSVTLRLGAAGAPVGVGEILIARAAALLGLPAERFSLVATDTDSAPAEDAGGAETRVLLRAVEEAAGALAGKSGKGRRSSARASARAPRVLEASDVPASTAAVFAEVEVDTETGVARTRRLAVVPVDPAPTLLGAWEDGQVVAALPLVFGGTTTARALDAPAVERPPTPTATTAVAALPDLLPAAAAALAQALAAAAGVPVRELPVRMEELVATAPAAHPPPAALPPLEER